MTKTNHINIRIDPETKARADELFSDLGLSTSEAVNIFLRRCIIEEGIPFDVRRIKKEAAPCEGRIPQP